MRNPVGVEVIRNLIGIVESYGQKIKLAIIVSTSGFSKELEIERLRYSSKSCSIILLKGKELEEFHTSRESMEEFMSKKVRENVFV